MDEVVPANERRDSERIERGKEVTQAQKVFEALMTAKGYTDFTQVKGRYVNAGVQTRWNYFQLGWQLRGVQ